MNQTIRPRRGRRVILILLAILLFFAAANCFLNRNLWVTSYTISSSRLPENSWRLSGWIWDALAQPGRWNFMVLVLRM